MRRRMRSHGKAPKYTEDEEPEDEEENVAVVNGERPSKRKRKERVAPAVKKARNRTSTSELKSEQKQVETNDGRSYWLMKAEPESRIEKGIDVKFSIDDLAAATEPEGWDGVRNPVARNNMRAMKLGDLAFFYHSNCKTPGIVGAMEIVKEHSPDKSAQNPKHPYYDPKDSPEKPKWSLVHVEFRRKFPRLISLKELQKYKQPGGELEGLQTLRMSRLSVSRVAEDEWNFILGLLEEQEDGAVGV